MLAFVAAYVSHSSAWADHAFDQYCNPSSRRRGKKFVHIHTQLIRVLNSHKVAEIHLRIS